MTSYSFCEHTVQICNCDKLSFIFGHRFGRSSCFVSSLLQKPELRLRPRRIVSEPARQVMAAKPIKTGAAKSSARHFFREYRLEVALVGVFFTLIVLRFLSWWMYNTILITIFAGSCGFLYSRARFSHPSVTADSKNSPKIEKKAKTHGDDEALRATIRKLEEDLAIARRAKEKVALIFSCVRISNHLQQDAPSTPSTPFPDRTAEFLARIAALEAALADEKVCSCTRPPRLSAPAIAPAVFHCSRTVATYHRGTSLQPSPSAPLYRSETSKS